MVRSIKKVLEEAREGSPVQLAGWVRSTRHSKGISFIDLTDGSCLSGIQIVAEASLDGYDAQVAPLRTGCSVKIRGELVTSPGKGQQFEVKATGVELIGDVTDDYPLQKKRHSFEFLRTVGHLRPRTNTLGAVLRVRSAASSAIHAFFEERGFIYLHTPIITLTDAEGAGEMFRVTTLDPIAPPTTETGAVDFHEDFFGGCAHLTVSGQLEAEVGALSMSRVYTFGPTFRAENSNTTRHLAEFWMVEPEVSFCDLDDLRQLAQEFIQSVISTILDRCSEDLAFFDQRIEKGLLDRHRRLVETPFAHLTYSEAIDVLEKCGQSFENEIRWGVDLQTEHERYLCERHIGGPLVVTDYPADRKAFYMYRNDDQRTVRAMDVLVPGVGEIIGGSQREHRLASLEDQLERHGLPKDAYSWYLDLRRYGSVPHSGFGLGFERFVRFLTGMENIRDVMPFPRVPGSAGF